MEIRPEQTGEALRSCIAFQLANKKLDVDKSETVASNLNKAFNEVPQAKFLSQAQYLREYMLPKIEKSRGLESAEYTFYYAVFESLMYAFKMADRDQSLRMRLTNEMLLNEIYHKKIVFYQQELQKYTTLEMLSDKELATELIKRQTAQ